MNAKISSPGKADLWIWGSAFLIFIFFASIASAADVQGCPFVQPFYGKAICEVVDQQAINIYGNNYFGEANGKAYISDHCKNDENSPRCFYYFKCDSVGTDVFGKADCQITGVAYRYCNALLSNFDCDSSATPWIQKLSLQVQPGEEVSLIEIPAGKYIQVSTSINWGSSLSKIKVYLLSKYTAYGLNIEESGAKYRYNTKSCSIIRDTILPAGVESFLSTGGNFQQKNLMKSCPSNFPCETTGSTQQNIDIRQTQKLDFLDWVNYVSTYVYAPIDINNKVVVYNGEQAYCQPITGGANLLRIEKIETQGGCYTTPTKIITGVTCCPGQESANARCSNAFKWEPIITGECDASRACQAGYSCQKSVCVRQATCFSDLQCTGQGAFQTDYSIASPTVARYGCIEGQCQIVERKKVQCTPPSTGCQSGTLCDPVSYTCIKQEGGSSFVNQQFGLDRLLANFLKAAVLAVITLIIVFVASRFLPFGKFITKYFSTPQGFISATVVLALVFMLMLGGFG